MKTTKICTYCGSDDGSKNIIMNLENTRFQKVLFGYRSEPCGHCGDIHPPWVCVECYKILLEEELLYGFDFE